MNLHANAALSLKGRRKLCRRVVERERTLAQAAEAAGVSVRCARKWVGRYRAEGELGLLRSVLGAAPDPAPDQRAAGRGDRRAAAVAVHRPGDRRGARHGALDRVGDPDQDRDGQARPARPRARRPLRARAARRADPHRHQEARTDPARRRAPVTGQANRGSRPRKRRRSASRARSSAGSACTSRSMTATRLAYAEVLPDEKASTVIGFLSRAVAFYARHGITVSGS